MSFSHKSVVEIEAHTNKVLANLQTADAHGDLNLGDVVGSKRLEEGFYVVPKLAALCDELRTVFRGVKFGVVRGCKGQYVTSFVTLSTEVWMYMPGDEYAPMRIGYDDYAIRTTKVSYAVYARSITNFKFGERREHYHMKLASDLKAAVAAVRKYFRRYTTPEIAGMSIDELTSKLHHGRWEACSASNDALRALTNHDSFLSEMRLLSNSGYTFNDPGFAEAIRTAFTKMQEERERSDRHEHGWYVIVRDGLNGQEVDLIEVLDIRKHDERTIRKSPVTTYTNGNLPEGVAEKIAALSMLQPETFIDQLGMKVDDTKYWVMR